MLSKLSEKKALYQVRLILDYLPNEEYKLIPKEKIKYINDNYEYDENIFIDPYLPLDEQNIDDKAYEILDDILNSIKGINEKVNEINELDSIKGENIRLNNLVCLLQKENKKIKEAEKLVIDYRKLIKTKDDEISNLKENNEKLHNIIAKMPKFIVNFFAKEDIKLLSSKGED